MLGESFLRQTRLLAGFADCLTQSAAVFRNRRHTPYKQEQPENNIYYSIILHLLTHVKKRRNASVVLRTKGFMRDKVKILIVEDEMPLAMAMISVLTIVGCDVEAAHTGKKAMEKAAETKFDLIALDIELPDVSGFRIFRELKQRHISRHTPVIFISASSRETDRQQSLRLGAVDYIEKPFKANSFVSRLLAHVEKVHSAVDSPFDEEFQ